MNFAKKVMMFVGFGVLAAALVSVLAPKAAHALVATLVQVVSSTSNPVVTLSADTATRIPYQSASQGTCNINNCSFVFTTVPAGHRLVVQGITAIVPLNSGIISPTGVLEISHDGTLSSPNAYFLGTYIQDSYQVAHYNQAVTEFVDAGDYPQVLLYGDVVNGPYSEAILTGYLENCAAVGCPAVQH